MKRKSISKADREKVYQKYNGHCAYCGIEITMKTMQVDHLIPMEFHEAYIVAGKDIDTMSNYMPACRSCNNYKSSLTLDKFRGSIERFTTVLQRDSVTYRNAVRFGQIIPNGKPVVFYFEGVEVEA